MNTGVYESEAYPRTRYTSLPVGDATIGEQDSESGWSWKFFGVIFIGAIRAPVRPPLSRECGNFPLLDFLEVLHGQPVHVRLLVSEGASAKFDQRPRPVRSIRPEETRGSAPFLWV